MDEHYGVVMPQYFLRSLQEFTVLINSSKKCVLEEEDYTIVAKYIEIKSPVKPRIEGRIIITHGEIREVMLPMISYIVVVLIIYIFKDTILTPVSIFGSSNEIPSTTSTHVEYYEYSKLVSFRNKIVQSQ